MPGSDLVRSSSGLVSIQFPVSRNIPERLNYAFCILIFQKDGVFGRIKLDVLKSITGSDAQQSGGKCTQYFSLGACPQYDREELNMAGCNCVLIGFHPFLMLDI